MKVAILAGGWGTRLSEETDFRPKPMVEIGGRPMLWHIMTYFSVFGYDTFSIALGYKGEHIKRWAIDMATFEGDLKISTSERKIENHSAAIPNWSMDLVQTGLTTNTGGRIKRLRSSVGEETFFLAWGDGVSNVDLSNMLSFHLSHKKLATVMIVRPPARFGHVRLDGDRISTFEEKPQTAEGWINGGVFILEPQVFDYIEGDDTAFEKAPMKNLARDGQLMAYRHEGFWQCMDTLRDKRTLEEIWRSGDAPWKTWKDDGHVSWSPAIVAT